jgi:hypothetical protein
MFNSLLDLLFQSRVFTIRRLGTYHGVDVGPSKSVNHFTAPFDASDNDVGDFVSLFITVTGNDLNELAESKSPLTVISVVAVGHHTIGRFKRVSWKVHLD